MSNYNTLKTAINANIKQNGNQEITGSILNSVLKQMVDVLGTGYQFAGIATPATNPGTPDAKVFYIANGKETYEKFGGLEVTEDEVVVLYWDTAWHKVSTGIAREEKLTDLENEIATKQDIIPDLDSIRVGATLGRSALQEETDPSVPSWAKEATKPSYTPEEIGAASEESLQSHENNNTRHITATERTEWNAKQDALTLTIKDNGNIVLANIQGQSAEFMPATPSGDPMHYAYVAAGAEWNGTGEDIVKTSPWADLADDEADKTVVHKAGYWYLNGLGDITTEQMRLIYNEKDNNTFFSNSLRQIKQKTNIPIITTGTYIDADGVGYGCLAKVICFDGHARINKIYAGFRNSYNLCHILGVFLLNAVNNPSYAELFLSACPKLISVKISNIKINLILSTLPMLSCKSILYMIQNEIATTNITITLHADAYARAMVNADILAALEAHHYISLASA